tara:strand:+ start:973 stop:1740 length:768 start_codon:yes stop_codon:yes gene_type:complete
MFTNNFDPVALNLLSFEVRWYSLAYIFGIIAGWIYIKTFLIKNEDNKKNLDDLITYLIIGIIIGGRLGYVLFYNFNYYFNNFFEILVIWEGGMSFHGGLIGVFISTLIFCKKRNVNPYIFLDSISAAAPIGIFFGRLANYLNSELYGKETTVPWSVIFQKVDNIQRHPSQIYEAILEGLLLFIILNIFIRSNFLNKRGLISALFLILYSIFRFFSEIFREPDPQIGYIIYNLSMGQILSLFMLFFGIIIFLKNEK